MDRMSGTARGLTLIDLLIVMLILMVTITLAVPPSGAFDASQL
jgi:competence protein ComGC